MKERLKRMQIKGFAIGVLLTVMLSATLVWANPGGVMREVFYGVNITVNGTPWNPPSDMTPFINDGRTFLPVRGIAELLDVPVDWDGATRTVYVGTIPHGAPFWTTVPAFQGSGLTIATINMLGNPFPGALRTTNAPVEFGSRGWGDHNLNGHFNAITGTIGRIDGNATQGSATISFIGDDRTLATFSVDANSRPENISVDVRGVFVLRVEIEQTGGGLGRWGIQMAFANAMIE